MLEKFYHNIFLSSVWYFNFRKSCIPIKMKSQKLWFTDFCLELKKSDSLFSLQKYLKKIRTFHENRILSNNFCFVIKLLIFNIFFNKTATLTNESKSSLHYSIIFVLINIAQWKNVSLFLICLKLALAPQVRIL